MFCVVFVGITVSHPLFEAGVWAFLYPLLCELLAGLLFSNAIKYTRLLVSFHLCNLLGRAAQPVLQECGSSELRVWRWRLTSHSCFIYQRLNSSRIELQHNVQKGDFVSEPFSNVLSVWKSLHETRGAEESFARLCPCGSFEVTFDMIPGLSICSSFKDRNWYLATDLTNDRQRFGSDRKTTCLFSSVSYGKVL